MIQFLGNRTPFGASPVRPGGIAAINEKSCPAFGADGANCKARRAKRFLDATGAERGTSHRLHRRRIVIGVAACMTRAISAASSSLPDTNGMKNEVVMQKGHGYLRPQRLTERASRRRPIIEIGAATHAARISCNTR